MSRTHTRSWGTWIRWGGTLLSVGLLIWLLERQDWTRLLEAAGSVGLQVLLLSLAFVLFRFLLNVGRWYALVRSQPIDMGVGEALHLTFAGLFASNFLPTTVGGDILRLVGVMDASEERFEASTTVLLDRIVGGVGMILLLPLGLPILAGLINAPAWFGGAGMAVGPALGRWLRGGWARTKTVLVLWGRKPGALALSLGFNLAGIASYLMSVWLLANAMGIDVTYLQVAGAVSLTYFVTLLPISVSGYGVRELGVVAVFTQLGALPEQASALALLTRGLIWAGSLPGLLWLGTILRTASEQLADLSVNVQGQA